MTLQSPAINQSMSPASLFRSCNSASVIAFVPNEPAAQAVQRAWLQADAVDRIYFADAPARPVVRVEAA